MFVTDAGQNVAVTFFLLVFLFALWGFCNGMIDVMDKHFQEQLHLSLSQSAKVQRAHYLGYLLMAVPAGWLATRLGYKGGIITGLLIVAVGGCWFIPATHIGQFWAFLVGVCIIAAGLTFLETVANPYTTVLGPSEYSATRINLAQSCNGIGLVFGPIVGAKFFYSKNAAGVSTGSETLWIPYAFIAAVVIVLAVVFYFAYMPDIRMEDDYPEDGKAVVAEPGSEWLVSWVRPFLHPHFTMAVVAQLLYVGAQAGVWRYFINHMTTQTPAVPGSWEAALQRGPGLLHGWFETKGSALTFSDKGASSLASLAFLCFLGGRFTGSAILRKFAAHRVLGLYGLLNVAACFVVFLKLGWLSVAAVFASYFFMSIMFPTIFALGIFGLGEQAKKASSFIVMAIVGGAFIPQFMGEVGDQHGMSRAFIVPIICFAIVAAYGLLWPRLSGAECLRGVAATGSH